MKSAASIKYAIKYAIAHTFYALGLLQLWQRIVLRRRAVVLMYHRVLTAEEMRRSGSHPGMIVESETFAAQMAILKRRFKVLSLEQFSAHLEQQIPFDDSSCLITFDDGWRDNFTNALPILKRYELPAVVFLPVNFIDTTRLFWKESLVHLLVLAAEVVEKEPGRKASLFQILAPLGLGHVLNGRDVDLRAHAIELLSEHNAQWSHSVIDSVLNRLRQELGVEHVDRQRTDSFLSWEQVNEMIRQGVVVGGHGAEHLSLGEIPIDAARREIDVSKAVIDLRCKPAIPTFSYPRGSWNAPVVQAVKAAGFRLVFTTNGGYVSAIDDPFTLRRMNIHQDATASTPMFLARIVGLF